MSSINVLMNNLEKLKLFKIPQEANYNKTNSNSLFLAF